MGFYITHLYDIFRVDISLETETGLEFVGGLEERCMGNDANGYRASFGGDVMFWNWVEVVLHNIANVLSAIELFTFEWFILCYRNLLPQKANRPAMQCGH